MPIDAELKEAVHQSIIRNLQQLSVENQLVSLLNEMSEDEISHDRRMQRINLLQTELELPEEWGERRGN